MTDWLTHLCAQVGVHTRYRGFEGQTVEVSRETQLAVLRAMGLDVGTDANVRATFEQLKAQDSARPLPPEVIVQAGQPAHVTLAQPVEWYLEAEDTDTSLASGQAFERLSLPALPMGIHRLRLLTQTGEYISWVLSRPKRAVQLNDHLAEPRIWGVLAALYGLTDRDTAQIGSYDLLGKYAAAMAAYGADFVGVNPVHAMGNLRPDDVISSYSPSHRGVLNTWHCGTPKNGDAPQSTLVDYPAALSQTGKVLWTQFDAFAKVSAQAPEKQAYRAFEKQMGQPLHDYAVFEALSTVYGADWRDWPAAFRGHDPKTLAGVAVRHADEIAFTKWAQWQADVQLAGAQTAARDGGMRVGLYLDLAVGPRLGGAETWAKGTSLITGATLGAPPDPLGPLGQSWGLAPQSPVKCRAEGYAGFARLLRAIMRHAGMIRIDHVLGLMRSFWIPEGAQEGTYVSYPLDALLAVVAIESVRNDAIVVGEDLGLVPAGLREKLAASGIYGLDVLQYMRDPKGGFVPPSKTRKLAVCGFATHDTPTITGFFAAEDARARHDVGGIDAQTLADTRADRACALKTLRTDEPVTEIHRHLARSNAAMVAIQLDDIARRPAQQNLPGTVDSYPNWRFKSPLTLADIATSAPLAELAKDMAAQNRSNPKGMEKADALQDCSDHAH